MSRVQATKFVFSLLLVASSVASLKATAEVTEQQVHKYVKASGGVQQVLSEMAAKASENIPQKIDSETELFAVTVFGSEINFNNRLLNKSKSEIEDIQAAKQYMFSNNLQVVCSSPVAKVLIMQYGAKYNYSLYSSKKEYLFGYSATPETCREVLAR